VTAPFTIGGRIRDITDSALEVVKECFASGADKVSIGSDAVAVAEAYYTNYLIP